MTPYYVMHKPNAKEKLRNTSYIYYTICAHQQMHDRAHAGHSNRVFALYPRHGYGNKEGIWWKPKVW